MPPHPVLIPEKLPHSIVPIESAKPYLTPKEQATFETFFRVLDREIINGLRMIEVSDGTQYPVMKLDLKSVAYKILGMSVSQRETIPEYSQYTIGSAIAMSDGWALGHIEETYIEAIHRLPKIINAIKNGEEPENTYLYNIGYPSFVQGRVSEVLSQESRNNPNGALAKRFAEYVASQPQAKKTGIYGASMGANVAAPLGDILFGQGEDVEVTLESPVTLQEGRFKLGKIVLGFFADAAIDPNIRSSRKLMGPLIGEQKKFQNAFLKNPNPPSKEEEARKAEFHRSLLRTLGAPFPRIETEVTIVAKIGEKDLSMRYGNYDNVPKNIAIETVPNEHHLRDFYGIPKAKEQIKNLVKTLLP